MSWNDADTPSGPIEKVLYEVKKTIVGQDALLERLIVALLARGHVLKVVEPEEVASLALWLAGDDAGMVTGASYTMDGGWSAR